MKEDRGGGEATVDLDLETVDVEVVEGRLETSDVDAFLDELADVERRHDVAVQAFDSRYVASPRHLRSAAAKARRAWRRGEEVADSLSMEVMLYAAGTRQISRATETGVREGGCDAVVALTPDESSPPEGGVPEEAVDAVEELLEAAEVDYLDRDTVTEFFDVHRRELEAVGDDKLELLVLERVALLEINK